jgi:hypothetical protein
VCSSPFSGPGHSKPRFLSLEPQPRSRNGCELCFSGAEARWATENRASPEAAIAHARRLTASLGLLRHDGGREWGSGSHLAAHFFVTSR